jgi:hypothetical protein
MSSRQQTHTQQPHSAEIRQVYERLLTGGSVASRFIQVGAGGRAISSSRATGRRSCSSTGAVVRAGAPGPGQAARTARSTGVARNPWSAADAPGLDARGG